MRGLIVVAIVSFLTFFYTFSVVAAGASADAENAARLSSAEVMRYGEKMYRDGILPSGKPMEAFIKEDVAVDSRAFSCASCHLRAGLGSVEGGVVTPPTTGKKLYAAYRRPPSFDDIPDRAGRYIYAKTVIERPAYTRETLKYAIRFGIDPAGQRFNDVMPRYPLSDDDMEVLLKYLEMLSLKPSPGATSGEFNFATIVTDDVSQEDREALLNPIRWFIKQKNDQMALYRDFLKFDYSPTIDMKYAFYNASLDVWNLSGEPETWGKQLSAYMDKKPVFAVLGGISNKSWRPIHDFCEEKRLPCLFPITDLPVVSDSGWYTQYFNKGYFQEGEVVARYISRHDTYADKPRILQLVQDNDYGKALAEGFNKTWSELDRSKIETVVLPDSDLMDVAKVGSLLNKEQADVLILWADGRVLTVLPDLVKHLDRKTPVFMSAGYLGQKLLKIEESLRDRLYLTYPYRLTPYVGTKDGGRDAKVPIFASVREAGDRRITSRTVTMLQQAASRGLNQIYDNLYGDHLMDVMGMQMDIFVRDYERLSFGPGQRFASKGCYIVKLGNGELPELLPVSEWVMH